MLVINSWSTKLNNNLGPADEDDVADDDGNDDTNVTQSEGGPVNDKADNEILVLSLGCSQMVDGKQMNRLLFINTSYS